MVDSPHNHVATRQQQLPYTRRSRQWLNSLVKGKPVKPDTSKVRPGVSAAPLSIEPMPRTDRNSRIVKRASIACLPVGGPGPARRRWAVRLGYSPRAAFLRMSGSTFQTARS